MSYYDDPPYICEMCGNPFQYGCKKFDGECEPWMIAIVTEKEEIIDKLMTGPHYDAFWFVYRLDGRWHGTSNFADLNVGDAWGIPLVYDSEVLLANCDRIVRSVLDERSPDAAAHEPVRAYDSYTLPAWVMGWARELGAQVVETGKSRKAIGP